MRNIVGMLVLCLCVAGFAQVVDDDYIILRRGDVNLDDQVTQADGVWLTNWLFLGGPEPGCMNQADANDDGKVDSSDAVYIYSWLFSGGPQPPSPGPYGDTCTVNGVALGCEDPPCSLFP